MYINNKSISKIVRNENGGNMSLKGSNTTATYLEWAEFQFLIQRLEKDKDYKYCLLIATGVYTGLRISDLLNIKYSDIIGKERLVVTEKKTNKRREIKINKDLRELVERIFQVYIGYILFSYSSMFVFLLFMCQSELFFSLT